MRIARLCIRNWLAYRGEHRLDLQPKVYAIVASYEGDPERSNWAGKSALLEAVVFALYGEHRFRTEDEFISEGEGSCEVELVLDDGRRIVRSRSRGKRTTLYLFEGTNVAAAMQERAQERIVEIVGLTRTDFGATSYWEQKQMARFVVARPEERTQIVGSWFRIEPIKDCEKRARAAAADMESTLANVDEHLVLLAQNEAEIGKAISAIAAGRKVEEIGAELDALFEAQKGKVASAETDLQRNAELAAGKGRVADYDQVVAEGKKARAEVERRNLPVLQSAWQAADASAKERAIEYGTAFRDQSSKEQVARGEFDGRCPVAEIECPAKARINEEREGSRKALEAAKVATAGVQARLAEAKAAEMNARTYMQEAERLAQRLEALREQAARLAPAAKAAKAGGEPEDPAVVRGRLEAERTTLMEISNGITRLKGWVSDIAKIETTRLSLKARRAELELKLATPREAAAVFKAAQRRVAEGSLALIQRDANDVLRASGSSLEVEVSWSREGRELATACEQCGHPFPKSAKVKNCEKCGTDRGLKVENKLEIHLSRRSGAAEDLAGAAVQLAASRWLREARGTAWSTALLDEPFGALDASHRRGFAAHLTAMLSGAYGFEQAFVVAHHAAVLDALPGRIEVVSDGTWAVPKVVA